MEHNHLVATITISAKKGDTQKTRWLIQQSRPYPCLVIKSGRAQWENADGLIGRHGGPAEGIGKKYHCYLLAEGVTPPEDFNRTHFAGYSHKPGGYGTPEVTNPGGIIWRGQDLGEVSIDIDANRHSGAFIYGATSGSATGFLKEQVVPALHVFIKAHEVDLKKQATDAIEKRMMKEIEEARASLAVLESMTTPIISNA